MFKTGKYTTILLVIIILILLFGVGIAVYYALDLDWFKDKTQEDSTKVTLYTESIVVKKEYDMSKRTYDLLIQGREYDVKIYKNGTVGVIMKDSTENKNVEVYSEFIGTEQTSNVNGIVKAFEVQVTKDRDITNMLLLLDKKGNLYKLANINLIDKDKVYIIAPTVYEFTKLEGLTDIVYVSQVANDYLTYNQGEMNVVAIDSEGRETIITPYLIEK